MPGGFEAAATIGSALIGAIGGRGRGKRTRQQWAREDSAIQRKVSDARAAGIHPLFALGGATGGTSAQITPPSGNIVGNALTSLARQHANKGRAAQSSLVDSSLIDQATANTRLANARAESVEWELKNSINKRAEGEANIRQDVVIPDILQGAQEINMGQVDPFKKKAREQSLNIKSPMTQVRIGSQNVWVPVEEIDEFMENPLAVGGLTFVYHGNKNVDWTKLAREYTGKKSLSKTMRANIRKHIPVRVRKNHLLKKYAKPFRGGPSP